LRGTCARPVCQFKLGRYRMPIDMVKPAELVDLDGKRGLRVYLCQPCAAKLRTLRDQGADLRSIDLRLLCDACRAPVEATKGYF
jgi:hypothetical protein